MATEEVPPPGRRHSLIKLLRMGKLSINPIKKAKDKFRWSSFDTATADSSEESTSPTSEIGPLQLSGKSPDPENIPAVPKLARGRSLSQGPLELVRACTLVAQSRTRQMSDPQYADSELHINDESDPKYTPKMARFREDVDVYHHDDEGLLAFKNCVQLKAGGKLRKKRIPSEDDDDMLEPEEEDEDDLRVCVSPSTQRKKQLFSVEEVEVMRKQGQKHLKLVVNLGRRLADAKISLRALKDGSKLILTVQKMEPLGDGTEYLRTYVDRFALPQPINCDVITANMEKNGWLSIETPLL